MQQLCSIRTSRSWSAVRSRGLGVRRGQAVEGGLGGVLHRCGAGGAVRGVGGGVHRQPGERDPVDADMAARPLRLALRAVGRRVRGVRRLDRVQSLRDDATRRRRGPSGVPHVVLGGDDVQRGDGDRADVLRRRRADLASGRAAAGARRTGDARHRPARDAVHVLPLGAHAVGDLRRGGAHAGLLLHAQGAAEPCQRGVSPADRQPRGGPGREGHRRAGDLGDAVRQRHVAGLRRGADQQRPELPLGRVDHQHAPGADHRGADGVVRGVGDDGRREGRSSS